MKSILVALVACLVFATLALREAEAGCSYRSYCCSGWWWRYKCRTCYKSCTHGGWSDWGKFTSCSDRCVKSRTRSCTNPRPTYGGKYCEGSAVDTQKCYEGECLEAACKEAYQKDRYHHSLPGSCVNFVKCDFKAMIFKNHVCDEGTVWSDDIQNCVKSHDTSKCDQEAKCKHGEPLSNPEDCSKYFMCVHGHKQLMPCPAGMYFDSLTNGCHSRKENACIQ